MNSHKRWASLVRYHLQNADIDPGDRAELAALADYLEDRGEPCRAANDSEPATESTVATEAHGLVYGDRQGDYGHPREDFTRTAVIWTGLLQHKLADGAYIDPEDIARCMVGVKLARDVHSPKRDNRVDMAGYAITLDRLETGR